MKKIKKEEEKEIIGFKETTTPLFTKDVVLWMIYKTYDKFENFLFQLRDLWYLEFEDKELEDLWTRFLDYLEKHIKDEKERQKRIYKIWGNDKDMKGSLGDNMERDE